MPPLQRGGLVSRNVYAMRCFRKQLILLCVSVHKIVSLAYGLLFRGRHHALLGHYRQSQPGDIVRGSVIKSPPCSASRAATPRLLTGRWATALPSFCCIPFPQITNSGSQRRRLWLCATG